MGGNYIKVCERVVGCLKLSWDLEMKIASKNEIDRYTFRCFSSFHWVYSMLYPLPNSKILQLKNNTDGFWCFPLPRMTLIVVLLHKRLENGSTLFRILMYSAFLLTQNPKINNKTIYLLKSLEQVINDPEPVFAAQWFSSK